MTEAVISVLNSLLMEEMTAAEAYRQVVQRQPNLDIKAELEELHIAHSKRAQKLKKRLRELAGNSPETFAPSTHWTAFSTVQLMIFHREF
ncbi:MAG: hypothetical protein U0103_02625 [Candidatus Obscuribacterales bacterium]